MVALLMAGSAHAASSCDDEAVLTGVIDVYAAPSESLAIENAQGLVFDVIPPEQGACDSLQDATVDAIATLLTHPSNGVKVYAAHALGKLGKRAARALPELEAARNAWREPDPPRRDLRLDEVVVRTGPDGVSELEGVIAGIQAALEARPDDGG